MKDSFILKFIEATSHDARRQLFLLTPPDNSELITLIQTLQKPENDKVLRLLFELLLENPDTVAQAVPSWQEKLIECIKTSFATESKEKVQAVLSSKLKLSGQQIKSLCRQVTDQELVAIVLHLKNISSVYQELKSNASSQLAARYEAVLTELALLASSSKERFFTLTKDNLMLANTLKIRQLELNNAIEAKSLNLMDLLQNHTHFDWNDSQFQTLVLENIAQVADSLSEDRLAELIRLYWKNIAKNQLAPVLYLIELCMEKPNRDKQTLLSCLKADNDQKELTRSFITQSRQQLYFKRSCFESLTLEQLLGIIAEFATKPVQTLKEYNELLDVLYDEIVNRLQQNAEHRVKAALTLATLDPAVLGVVLSRAEFDFSSNLAFYKPWLDALLQFCSDRTPLFPHLLEIFHHASTKAYPDLLKRLPESDFIKFINYLHQHNQFNTLFPTVAWFFKNDENPALLSILIKDDTFLSNENIQQLLTTLADKSLITIIEHLLENSQTDAPHPALKTSLVFLCQRLLNNETGANQWTESPQNTSIATHLLEEPECFNLLTQRSSRTHGYLPSLGGYLVKTTQQDLSNRILRVLDTAELNAQNAQHISLSWLRHFRKNPAVLQTLWSNLSEISTNLKPEGKNNLTLLAHACRCHLNPDTENSSLTSDLQFLCNELTAKNRFNDLLNRLITHLANQKNHGQSAMYLAELDAQSFDKIPANTLCSLLCHSLTRETECNWKNYQTFLSKTAAKTRQQYMLLLTEHYEALRSKNPLLCQKIWQTITQHPSFPETLALDDGKLLLWLIQQGEAEALCKAILDWFKTLAENKRLPLLPLPQIFASLPYNEELLQTLLQEHGEFRQKRAQLFLTCAKDTSHHLHLRILAQMPKDQIPSFLTAIAGNATLTLSALQHTDALILQCLPLDPQTTADAVLVCSQLARSLPLFKCRESFEEVQRLTLNLFDALVKDNCQWASTLFLAPEFTNTLQCVLDMMGEKATEDARFLELLLNHAHLKLHPSFLNSSSLQKFLLKLLKNPPNTLNATHFELLFNLLIKEKQNTLASALLSQKNLSKVHFNSRLVLSRALTKEQLFKYFQQSENKSIFIDCFALRGQGFAELNSIETNTLFAELETTGQIQRILSSQTTPQLKFNFTEKLFACWYATHRPLPELLQHYHLSGSDLIELANYSKNNELISLIEANPLHLSALKQFFANPQADFRIEQGSVLMHFLGQAWENPHKGWRCAIETFKFIPRQAQIKAFFSLCQLTHTIWSIEDLLTLMEDKDPSTETLAYALFQQDENRSYKLEVLNCAFAPEQAAFFNPNRQNTKNYRCQKQSNDHHHPLPLFDLLKATPQLMDCEQIRQWLLCDGLFFNEADYLQPVEMQKLLGHFKPENLNHRLEEASSRVDKIKFSLSQLEKKIVQLQTSTNDLNTCITTLNKESQYTSWLNACDLTYLHVMASLLRLNPVPDAKVDTEQLLSRMREKIAAKQIELNDRQQKLNQHALTYQKDDNNIKRLYCIKENYNKIPDDELLASQLNSFLPAFNNPYETDVQNELILLLVQYIKPAEKPQLLTNRLNHELISQVIRAVIASENPEIQLLHYFRTHGFDQLITSELKLGLKRALGGESSQPATMNFSSLTAKQFARLTPSCVLKALTFQQLIYLNEPLLKLDGELCEFNADASLFEVLQPLFASGESALQPHLNLCREWLMRHLRQQAYWQPLEEKYNDPGCGDPKAYLYCCCLMAHRKASNDLLQQGLTHWLSQLSDEGIVKNNSLLKKYFAILQTHHLVESLLENAPDLHAHALNWLLERLKETKFYSQKTLQQLINKSNWDWIEQTIMSRSDYALFVLSELVQETSLETKFLQSESGQKNLLGTLINRKFSLPELLVLEPADSVKPLIHAHLLSREDILKDIKGTSLLECIKTDRQKRHPRRLEPWLKEINLLKMPLDTLNALPPEVAVSLLCSPRHFHQFEISQVKTLLQATGTRHQPEVLDYWLKHYSNMPNIEKPVQAFLSQCPKQLKEALEKQTAEVKECLLDTMMDTQSEQTGFAPEFLSLCSTRQLQRALIRYNYARQPAKMLGKTLIALFSEFQKNKKYLTPFTLEQFIKLSEKPEFSSLKEPLGEFKATILRFMAIQQDCGYFYDNGLLNTSRVQEVITPQKKSQWNPLPEFTLGTEVALEQEEINALEYFILHYTSDTLPLKQCLNDYIPKAKELHLLPVSCLMNDHRLNQPAQAALFEIFSCHLGCLPPNVLEQMARYDDAGFLAQFADKPYQTLIDAVNKILPAFNENQAQIKTKLETALAEAEFENAQTTSSSFFMRLGAWFRRLRFYGWSGFFKPNDPKYVRRCDKPMNTKDSTNAMEPFHKGVTKKTDLPELIEDFPEPFGEKELQTLVCALENYELSPKNPQQETGLREKVDALFSRLYLDPHKKQDLQQWLLQNYEPFTTNRKHLLGLYSSSNNKKAMQTLLQQAKSGPGDFSGMAAEYLTEQKIEFNTSAPPLPKTQGNNFLPAWLNFWDKTPAPQEKNMHSSTPTG